MKNQQWAHTTLALAGMVQAAKLVRDLARTGQFDETAFEFSIQSILKVTSSSVEDIFSGIAGVKLGLENIPTLFRKNTKKNEAEIIRYVISLIYLEKKFSQTPELKKILLRRIQQAESQAIHFSITDQHVIDTLAQGFLQTLGRFHYRIQIVGNVNYLKQTPVLAKIRSLLLAGIRSAVLWRQMGGNKWQLLFFRKKIIRTAKELLG